jgi:glycosyltransferase involved in cell wall biosynthesis
MIVERFIKGRDNFQLYKNSENRGIVETINKGIDLSAGKFIICLGHDDILLTNHVSTMVAEINDTDSAIYCNADLINEAGHVFGSLSDDAQHILTTLERKYRFMFGNNINSCGLMFRKESANKVGKRPIIPGMPHYGEPLFWIKLLTVGNISYTKTIRAQYRRHKTNISNTFVDPKHKVKFMKFELICMKFAYDSFYRDINFLQRIKAKLAYNKLLFKKILLELKE